jgi:hypothetical protein
LKKEVMLVTGAGQISMAIARRIGFGKKIILGDKKIENANAIAKIMNEAGYDVVPLDHPKNSKSGSACPHVLYVNSPYIAFQMISGIIYKGDCLSPMRLPPKGANT